MGEVVVLWKYSIQHLKATILCLVKPAINCWRSSRLNKNDNRILVYAYLHHSLGGVGLSKSWDVFRVFIKITCLENKDLKPLKKLNEQLHLFLFLTRFGRTGRGITQFQNTFNLNPGTLTIASTTNSEEINRKAHVITTVFSILADLKWLKEIFFLL